MADKIKSTWLSSFKTKEERDEFKKLLKNSGKTLDKLKEIVYNSIIKSEKIISSDYDNPSWAYKQADRNGYHRAYKEILSLLTLDDDED